MMCLLESDDAGAGVYWRLEVVLPNNNGLIQFSINYPDVILRNKPLWN